MKSSIIFTNVCWDLDIRHLLNVEKAYLLQFHSTYRIKVVTTLENGVQFETIKQRWHIMTDKRINIF